MKYIEPIWCNSKWFKLTDAYRLLKINTYCSIYCESLIRHISLHSRSIAKNLFRNFQKVLNIFFNPFKVILKWKRHFKSYRNFDPLIFIILKCNEYLIKVKDKVKPSENKLLTCILFITSSISLQNICKHFIFIIIMFFFKWGYEGNFFLEEINLVQVIFNSPA